MPKLMAGRQRLRERSPDICAGVRVPPLPRTPQKKTVEPYTLRRPGKQVSTRRRTDDDDQLINDDFSTGRDVHFPGPSKRLAHGSDGGDSLEFSPNYDEDPIGDPEDDIDTVNPFAQDMFFPHDTSLVEAFGSLIPDPFISSSEPLLDYADESINDGLNTPPCRSPSPVTSPLVLPDTPDMMSPDSPAIMYAPPEPEVSPNTRRSLRSASRKSKSPSPLTTPTKALQPLTSVRQGRVNKVTPRKRSPKVERPVEDEDIVRMKANLESINLESTQSRLQRKRARMDSGDKEEVPPKSTIVPYVPQKPIQEVKGRPQRVPAIKGGSSPSSSEKSFKEIMSNYIHNFEAFQRPGKIKRLKLTNFMCHVCFDQDWNQMVNYIIADNGAGKSAILVAIQLVFGAKASTTMRSASVKELIQYNKYQATIEVTLANDGTLDMDKYGPEIVISRTIRDNGTSWYSIRKGESKAKRSLRRKELELILATLQIMVDNPAMILNQEASSNFLRENNPRALYMYFYRGLNLEHCELLLNRSWDDMESARLALNNKRRMLEELQSKARERKSYYDAVVTMENGKDKVRKLTAEHHWAIVAQGEEELASLQHKLDVVVDKCAELEKQTEDVSEQQNSLDKNQESSKSQLKKLKRLLHSHREELELKCREAHSHHQDLSNAKSKLSNLIKIINDKNRRLAGIEAEAERLRQESDANYKESVRERERQKYELLDRRGMAKERLAVAKSRKDESYTIFERCNEAQVEWHKKSEDIKFGIREKQHELLNIEKKQSSKYNRYGPEMVTLMAEIEKMAKRGQFMEMPMGPQSACYTVKESFREYAPLIEHILGSTIFQFRVGHVQDKVTLQNLMKKVYRNNKQQPDILYHPIKNRDRYNLLNVKASSGHNTVLDALDILDDDPVVVNWLADSNGIEKILLFPTEVEACNVMKEARRVPRGCNIAYTLNFKRIHADPHYRSMVINPYKEKTHFVQITSTSRLPNDELVKLEISQMEVELSQVSEMLRQAKNQTDMAEKSDRAMDRELRQAQNEVTNIETLIQGLEDAVVQGPDLASYIEDGEELRASINQNMVEKSHWEAKVEELKPIYAEVENQKTALEESIENTEGEIQLVENQSDFAKRANDLRIKLKNLNEELANQSAARQSLSKKVKETATSLDKNIAAAASTGSRVPKKREIPAIKEELRCLEAMLEKNKHKISQKASLKKEWDRAQEFADEVEQDIRSAGNLIKILLPTITTQRRRFKKKKSDFGNTLQASFQALISYRNFGGKLIIDHQEKNLLLWVCPDSNSEERANAYQRTLHKCLLYKKGMKDYISGLSGGERSFSNVCFMVSMWKVMEAPFYILDEFDAFMDEANRKASSMILESHTRNQPEAQFFFITPLKVDNIVSPNKYTKILRLYPPIRDSAEPLAITETAQKTNGVKEAEKRKGQIVPARNKSGLHDRLYRAQQPLAIKSH